MSLPLVNIVTTDTFRTWYNRTNDIINSLNNEVVAANTTAYGVFTVGGAGVANTSLIVEGILKVNSSLILASGNTTLAANVTATANANVINIVSGALILQPLNGTTVNTAISVNGALSVLKTSSFTANVAVTGEVTVAAGNVSVRQLIFASANTILAQSLANPQYDDYNPAGLAEAQILNLTPSIDTVFTGITAPTNVATGGRVLYIQNLATSFKISIVSGNTSSGASNRFKTPADQTIDILPGMTIGIMYSGTTNQWRPLGSAGSSFSTLTVSGNSALGNTVISGWLQVTGSYANVAQQLVVGGLSTLTGNVTMSGFANVVSTLQVGGAATLGGTLAVTGTSTLTGNTTFSGFANIASTLQVTGLSTLTGNVTMSGFANVVSTLQVGGVATLSANVSVGGIATVSANTILNGSNSFANGQFRCDTTNGRLVLPVGTNLWAT